MEKKGGPRGIDVSHISVSIGGTLPLPLPCPLLSVTLHRRQLFPLLGDDVRLKSGAPATQKARFGQNRVRGGATVKRKRSHRTPVYLEGGEGGAGVGGNDWVAYEIGFCVYVSGTGGMDCLPQTCQ